MTADDTSANPATQEAMPVPNPDLKSLDRLIGTWTVSGEAEGTVTYEWAEGGFFLLQLRRCIGRFAMSAASA
jgi:hypothetical protein